LGIPTVNSDVTFVQPQVGDVGHGAQVAVLTDNTVANVAQVRDFHPVQDNRVLDFNPCADAAVIRYAGRRPYKPYKTVWPDVAVPPNADAPFL